MRHRFSFSGGVNKYPEYRKASKFLLFHLLPDLKTDGVTEKIVFQSLAEGYVIYSAREGVYSTNDPYFKLFTLTEGFGIRKQFFSFYFKLDIHERETKILPLCEIDTKCYFSGKGRFMRCREVEELLGYDPDPLSYRLYKQQMPLSKSLLQRMVVRESDKEIPIISPSTSQIRRIRI